MDYLSGRTHAIDSEHVLESPRARQMWLEIVCDGQVSPIKVKCNSVHGRARRHAKVKCTSVHGKGRRHVEKINQTCKAKCMNSVMQKCTGCDKRACNTGQVRLRLRQKCAERCMYVDQVIPAQSANDVRQR